MIKGEPLYYFFNPNEGLRVRYIPSQRKVFYQYFLQSLFEEIHQANISPSFDGNQFQTYRQETWSLHHFEPEWDAFFSLRYRRINQTTNAKHSF